LTDTLLLTAVILPQDIAVLISALDLLDTVHSVTGYAVARGKVREGITLDGASEDGHSLSPVVLKLWGATPKGGAAYFPTDKN
jgi:hypothetical protein